MSPPNSQKNLCGVKILFLTVENAKIEPSVVTISIIVLLDPAHVETLKKKVQILLRAHMPQNFKFQPELFQIFDPELFCLCISLPLFLNNKLCMHMFALIPKQQIMYTPLTQSCGGNFYSLAEICSGCSIKIAYIVNFSHNISICLIAPHSVRENHCYMLQMQSSVALTLTQTSFISSRDTETVILCWDRLKRVKHKL